MVFRMSLTQTLFLDSFWVFKILGFKFSNLKKYVSYSIKNWIGISFNYF